MRGKIIQYNGADGSGTIVADGRQYRFELAAWRGDKAPAVNKAVEIELDNGVITAVSLVGDDVLMREKAAQMGNKFGAAWKQASASIQAGRQATAGGSATATGTASPASGLADIPLVGSIVKRYGIVIPIAWFVFLIGTLALTTVSISMSGFGEQHALSKSMFGTGAGGTAGGFFVRLLLILGYLSILVPMIWRDRRAWLALLLPLLAVVYAWIYTSHLLGQAHAKFDGMVSPYQGFAGAAGNGIALHIGHGFGFWLALIMALIVAALALMRFLAMDDTGVGQPAH